LNNLIGETIGSGRNQDNGGKDLFSTTHSEERVATTNATGVYTMKV